MDRLPTVLLDIAGCPSVSIPELLVGNVPRLASLYPANTAPDQPCLLGFGNLPERVRSAQRSTARIPDVRVYSVPDADVIGRSTVLKDEKIVSSADTLPPYVRLFYNKGLVPGPTHKHLSVVHHDAPMYLVTNYNTDNYGHFLLECLPKIMLVRMLFDVGMRFPILLPSSLPKFALDITNYILSFPDIVFFNVNTEVHRAKRLLLPSMFHTDYIYHKTFFEQINQLNVPSLSQNKRIYVSRSNIRESTHSFARNVINEQQIQQIAVERGFDVIYPETMDWSDQVARFSSANLIVGEYSSGMHNALFSPAATNVLVVNWVNDVQQRIAQSCSHRIGFVMPEDGNPRWFSHDRNVRQDYAVDPWEFIRAIEALCTLSR